MKRFLIFSFLMFSLGSFVFIYSADQASIESAEEQSKECAVCLNILDSSDTENSVTTLSAQGQCGHSFHTLCFERWMAQGSRTCPLCRARINTGNDLNFAVLDVQVDENGDLDLSERGLTTIQGLRNFEQKEQVRHLSLEDNSIGDIPGGEFASFVNLVKLDLDGNRSLRIISSEAFIGLNRLERLFLEGCELTSIGVGAFASLTRLNHLDLSNNLLGAFPVGLFAPLTNLEILDLQGLPLADEEKARIRAEVLAAAPNCKIYFVPGDVSDGSFRDMYLVDSGLETLDDLSNFEHKEEVVNLWLGFNQIVLVDSNHFDGFSNVTFLDLANNRITAIQEGAFDQLISLRCLHLNDNDYLTLPIGLFDPLINLQQLFLSTTLPDDQRQRILAEVAAVAPDCRVVFIDTRQ